MYNLHVENKKTKKKKKKPDYKKWQTPFVHHEKVYNLQMKTSTKTLYRPQFGFRQAERKKKKSENIISHHKVKNRDFKTSKKGETKKSS